MAYICQIFAAEDRTSAARDWHPADTLGQPQLHFCPRNSRRMESMWQRKEFSSHADLHRIIMLAIQYEF